MAIYEDCQNEMWERKDLLFCIEYIVIIGLGLSINLLG